MNDEELFELCTQVYEKTGWTPTSYTAPDDTKSVLSQHPLYNSDYLLAKLPHEISSKDDWDDEVTGSFGLWKSKGQFTCGYIDGENGFLPMQVIEDEDKYYTDAEWNADTPRKALLKLTLALAEAGEL